MASRSKKRKSPQFFKIMLGNFSERMRIPPAFQENMKDESSGHVIVKGPSGNIWHIELAKDDREMFFKNGWQEFVRDHSLQMGDVLIFRYDGNLHFTVQVFDTSACEKESAFYVKVCKTLSCEEKQERVEIGEKTCIHTEVSRNGARKATSKRKTGVHKQVPQQRCSCKKSASSRKTRGPSIHVCSDPLIGGEATQKRAKIHSADQPVTQKYPVDEAEKERIDETADSFKSNNPPTMDQAKRKYVKTHTGHPPFARKRLHTEKKETEFEAANSLKLKNPRAVMYMKAAKRKFDKFLSGYRPLTQRRIVTEEEKKRALKEANSFESNNPFAIIVMRQNYVYTGTCMFFPAEFTRDHLPKAHQTLILEDPKGRSWSVRFLYYKSAGAIGAGWRAFVYDKNVEEDDVCVFELLKEDVLRVHIFRVVKKITRMVKNSSKSNPRAGFGRLKRA